MTMTESPGDQTTVEQTAADLTEAACLFTGFSERARLSIVGRLLEREQRVVDLTWHLGLAQSTVSKHLACLRDCGIVEVRSEGRSSFYTLTHPESTRRLLEAAEELLELTGHAVALCPRYGIGAGSDTPDAPS